MNTPDDSDRNEGPGGETGWAENTARPQAPIGQDKLGLLRNYLDGGRTNEVLAVLWELADTHGLPGKHSWQPARLGSSLVEALITTWHWPERAWFDEDSQARLNWMENWQKDHPGKGVLDLIQRSDQALRNLADIFPGELFEVFANHHGWRHIRTSSSKGQNNILHVLSRTARSPDWVDQVLGQHGAWLLQHAPVGTSPAWMGCLDRGPGQAEPYLEVFLRHGHLDLSIGSVDLELLMTAAANRGQATCVVWALERSGTPRVPGVETRLAMHKKVDGKKDPTRMGKALDLLEQHWGPPDPVEMSGIWKSLFTHHVLGPPRAQGKSGKLAQHYERRLDQAGGWDETLNQYILDQSAQAQREDVLSSYVERGFSFTTEALEGARQKAERQSVYSGEPSAILCLLRRLVLAGLSTKREPSTRRAAM